MYEPEIAQLPLNQSRLIILSACETGAGDLEKGEGIMSLSRAFRYAGCPNIITSLWKANDFSTAYLTGRVHRYLGEGFSIDQALRKAKLDYLEDKTINPGMKHPFYWSHLVFIGNYSPEKKAVVSWYLIAAIGLFLIATIWLLTKKLRRSKAEFHR